MAAAKAIFGPIDEGVWLDESECAAIIDKHYAAQREAIGKAIEALEKLFASLPKTLKCHKDGVQYSARRYDIAFQAYKQLRGVHSGGSTGQAKEGGAS